MGLKRYLTPSNWYSDQVEFLLQRRLGELELVIMKMDHTVVRVTEANAADTQRFEEKSYTKIYRDMLSYGDMGYFRYIGGKCVCRLWEQIRLQE